MTLPRRLDELESIPFLRAVEAAQESEAALLALLDTLDRTVCGACKERADRRMLAALREAKQGQAGGCDGTTVHGSHHGR